MEKKQATANAKSLIEANEVFYHTSCISPSHNTRFAATVVENQEFAKSGWSE